MFPITATACAREVPMLDKNSFKAIVQFVLDEGVDAFLSEAEGDSLTPFIRYKDIIVYIIPNLHTRQRENIHDYSRIIVYGQYAVPISNRGPRFDIRKEGEHIYIEDKNIFDEGIINAYIALLYEMIHINRIVENINGIIDKTKFEDIVRFTLENGTEEPFSSLWGMSPFISYKDIRIFLTPNLRYFDRVYQAEMRNEISHYRRMTVFFDADGGHIFSMGIDENQEVYIHAEQYYNRLLYENAIVSVAIPLLAEMINE
jgi:hypothetical protein